MAKGSTSKRSVSDNPFLKCGECNKLFRNNSELTKHMETHSGTQLLLCAMCNKQFDEVEDLDKHYLLHRELLQPYGCPACDSRFETQNQLMIHVENIHPELTIGDNTRKNLPRSSKNQIKIKSVESVQKSPEKNKLSTQKSLSSAEENKSPSRVKRESPKHVKKSILKTAPTPSARKRPLVWKSPVVSPDKELRSRNIVTVQYQQSPGEKRKLVNASDCSPNAKKVKAATPNIPSTSTPIRKVSVTKTKLMQNIPDIDDKQGGKKSLAQTRKDLLNKATIRPVVKGPIRVSKQIQPFIFYSPNQVLNPVLQSGVKTYASSSSIGGNLIQTVISKNPNSIESSKIFDKLVTNMSPEANIQPKISQLANTSSISPSTTTKVITFPKKSPEMKVAAQTSSPVNTVKLNTSGIKCAVVSPENKIIKTVFPISNLPPGLKIINPSVFTHVQQSPSKKTVPVSNCIPSAKVQSTSKPSPASKMSKDIATCGHGLIPESEVLKDPSAIPKKLQIMFPSIQLRKISEAEFLKQTSKNSVLGDIKNEDKTKLSKTSVTITRAKRVTRQVQSSKSSSISKKTEAASSSDKSPRTSAQAQPTRHTRSRGTNFPVNATKTNQIKSNVKPATAIQTRKRTACAKSHDTNSVEGVLSIHKETTNKINKPPQSSSKSLTKEIQLLKNVAIDVTQKITAKVEDPSVLNANNLATRRSKRTTLKVVDKRSDENKVTKAKQNISSLKKTPLQKDILEEVTIIKNDEKEKVQEDSNKTSASPVVPSPKKISVVTLTPEMMQKLQMSVRRKATSATPSNIRLVVPPEVLLKMQNSTSKSQSSGSTASTNLPNSSPLSRLQVSVVPAPPKKIVRYGVEDLKRDQQRLKEEKERMTQKHELYKRMMEKFDEKEKKKQMKFCEKKLTRFLDKHTENHLEDLKQRLLNIRHLCLDDGIGLFQEVVRLDCTACKEVIGKVLCNLGFGEERDLFVQDKAVEGLISLTTSKARQKLSEKKNKTPQKEESKQKKSEEKPKAPSKKEQQLKAAFSIIECATNMGGLSYSNVDGKKSKNTNSQKVPLNTRLVKSRAQRNIRKKIKQEKDDMFADVSIITEEKFVLECPSCMKPNCDGIHPENFLI